MYGESHALETLRYRGESLKTCADFISIGADHVFSRYERLRDANIWRDDLDPDHERVVGEANDSLQRVVSQLDALIEQILEITYLFDS